jgi:multicomponent Na+:H+ antiporter subunit F
MILAFVRLRKGPHLADRVLALDLMTTIVMSLFGVFAVYSRQVVFVDVTLVLALVSFVSVVIYAKLVEKDAKSIKSLESDK